MGFAALTPTYLEHAARMRFGCDRSDFFRDGSLMRAIAMTRKLRFVPVSGHGMGRASFRI